MCLIVHKSAKEKIAEKDIICYKRLWYEDGVSYHAVQQCFRYKLGKEYKTSFTLVEETSMLGVDFKFPDEYSIDAYKQYATKKDEYGKPELYTRMKDVRIYQQGFHSYSSKKHKYERYPNVRCVIPKGTKYVKDKTGLICSEAIIIKEDL